MIVRVDLENGPSLEEPEVLTGFHAVSSTTDDSLVGAAMGEAGAPAGEGHVWVAASWVREQAAPVVAADWASAFEGMIDYARSKGWMNEAGTHIKAHVEEG